MERRPVKRLRVVAKVDDNHGFARGRDLEVYIVREDGTEERVPNIKNVTIVCNGYAEPVLATFEAYVDVDVIAQGDGV